MAAREVGHRASWTSTTTAGRTSSTPTGTSTRTCAPPRAERPTSSRPSPSTSTPGTGPSATSRARPAPTPSSPSLGRGTAFADLDNDGDLDVVVACLDGRRRSCCATTAAPGHWLMLRAVGGRAATGTASAPASPCATGALTQAWEVKRTVGIYSASDPRAHFGLGGGDEGGPRPGGAGRAGRWTSSGTCRPTGTTCVDEAEGLSPEPLRRR